MTKWNSVKSVPHDREILACFGFPWVSLAIWNEPSSQWCVTMLEVGMFEGKWNDATISHEYYSHKDMLGWMEMPQVLSEVVE